MNALLNNSLYNNPLRNGTGSAQLHGTPAQMAAYQRMVAEDAKVVAQDAARVRQWQDVQSSYEQMVEVGYQADLDGEPESNDYAAPGPAPSRAYRPAPAPSLARFEPLPLLPLPKFPLIGK